MTRPTGSPRPEGPFGREEHEFLEIAGALVGDSWNKHLKKLPWAVGDATYDETLTTITNRAKRGVAGFRDERGKLSPEKIRKYVKYVIDCKLKGAWPQGMTTLPLDDVRPPVHDAATDVFDRLVRERDDDELLRQARSVLAAFERRAREVDARRMSWIMHLLVEHGITGPGAELVLLRATRELTVAVGEGGLEVRFRPAPGMSAIAEQLCISHVYARQLSSRVRKKLPHRAGPLIDDPLAFQQLHEETEPSGDDGQLL